VLRALEQPLREIVANAGEEPSVVVNAVLQGTGNFGYNAATGEYGDLVAMGVLDPTKVTRTALQNAASIAGLMLTTDCMVAELPEDKPPMAWAVVWVVWVAWVAWVAWTCNPCPGSAFHENPAAAGFFCACCDDLCQALTFFLSWSFTRQRVCKPGQGSKPKPSVLAFQCRLVDVDLVTRPQSGEIGRKIFLTNNRCILALQGLAAVLV
jgi:hypothetical protein